ncbi:hypothetical protein ABPG74_015044 [Tetrahymena malaccensis]
MAFKYNIFILYALPIVLVFLILVQAIYISYVYSLTTTLDVVQYLQSQKKDSYDQRMLISYQQIGVTMQTLTSLFLIAGKFQNKIILGKININPLYQRYLINSKDYSVNTLAISIQNMILQNRYYLNEWQSIILNVKYFRNITNITNLSEYEKQDLLQYDLGGAFMQFIIKGIDLKYNSSKFTSFQLAKSDNGVFYFTPAYNNTLALLENPRNCQYFYEEFYDVRCSNWFQSTQSQSIIKYPNPYILENKIKVGMCQNLLKNGITKHSVICQIYNLDQFPETQQVVYDKNYNINYKTSPYTLRELLKRYQFDDQNIDYILSNFPQSYFKTHQNQTQGGNQENYGFNIQTGIFGLQVECLGGKKYINAYQGNVTYYQNGQSYTDNIFVNFSIIDYENIQTLSDNMQSKIFTYSVNTFVIGLLLSCFVLIFTIVSSVQITNQFLSSLENLTQILKTLHETKENSCLLVFEDEIINQLIEQKNTFLFAKEFNELFESFEMLLQTLKYASLQLTNGSKDNSLISWSMAVKFFQATNDSHRALGICWNNIGLIHFQQKRYIEAAQAFQNAIIQADYELGFYSEDELPLSVNINKSILDLKFKRIYSYQLAIKKWMKKNKDISIWKEYKQVMINVRNLAGEIPEQMSLHKLVISLDLVDSLIDSKQAFKAQKYINYALISFRDYQNGLDNTYFDNLNQNRKLSLSKYLQSSNQMQRKRSQSQNSPRNFQNKIQHQNSRITYQNSCFSNQQSPFLSNQKNFFSNQNISPLNQISSSKKNNSNQQIGDLTNLFEQSPLFICNQKTLIDSSNFNESHKDSIHKIQNKLSDSFENSKNFKTSGQNKGLFQINENFEHSYNSFCKSSTSSIKIQCEDSTTQLNYYKSISFHEKNLLVQKRYKPQNCVGDQDIQNIKESHLANESKFDEGFKIHKPFQNAQQSANSLIDLNQASKQNYIIWFRNKMYQQLFQNKNKQERYALLAILNEDIDPELLQTQEMNDSQQLSQVFNSFNNNKKQNSNSPDKIFSKQELKKNSFSNYIKRKIKKIMGNSETSKGNETSPHKSVQSKYEGEKKQIEREPKSNISFNNSKVIKVCESKSTKFNEIKNLKMNQTKRLRGNSIFQSQNNNYQDSLYYKLKNINSVVDKKNVQEIPESIFNSLITYYQANIMLLQKNYGQSAELLTQIFEQNQTFSTHINSQALKLLLQIIKNFKLSLLPIYSIQSSYGQFPLYLSFLVDCNQPTSQLQASKIISKTILRTLQEPNDRFNIHLNNILQTTLVKDLSPFKDKYATTLELKNLFQNIVSNFDKEKCLAPASWQYQQKKQGNLFKYFIQKSLLSFFQNHYHEFKVKQLLKQNQKIDFKKQVKRILIIITDQKIPNISNTDSQKLKYYSTELDIDILLYDLTLDSQVNFFHEQNNAKANYQYDFIKEVISNQKNLANYLINQRLIIKKLQFFQQFEYF